MASESSRATTWCGSWDAISTTSPGPASIALPSNLTEGSYPTRIFLTRGGRVVSVFETTIDVRKVGLERWLFTLSRQQPLVYGLMSLAIAIAAGWGASAAFRVLRRS